jgi:hypothetical protein
MGAMCLLSTNVMPNFRKNINIWDFSKTRGQVLGQNGSKDFEDFLQTYISTGRLLDSAED